MKQYRKGLTAVVHSVAKSLKLYLRRHHCCYCCTAVHVTPARLVYARSRSIAVCAPAVAGQGFSCDTHVAVRVCRPCLIGLPPTRSGSPLTSSISLPVKLGAVYGLPLPTRNYRFALTSLVLGGLHHRSGVALPTGGRADPAIGNESLAGARYILSLIHIPSPRDLSTSRMPSSA